MNHSKTNSILGNPTLFDSLKWYRFGFNGKEKETDINEGDYDFGARLYDGRIGRWFSPDPLAYQLSSTSPYCSFNNNPIVFVDDDGEIYRIWYVDENNTMQPFDFDGTNGGSAPDNPFVNAVIDSYNYIVNNGADYEGIMQKVATSSEIVNVYFKKVTQHRPNGNIEFNPAQTTEIRNGKAGWNKRVFGRQSAALSFYHESVHAATGLDGSTSQENEVIKYEKKAAITLEEKGYCETFRDDYYQSYKSKFYSFSPLDLTLLTKEVGKAIYAIYKAATTVSKKEAKRYKSTDKGTKQRHNAKNKSSGKKSK
jgi:RHS repeat-associated protein